MANFLYAKIYDEYKEKILSGTLKKGNRLPTEKEIGNSYGVSRITAIKAIQKLQIEGYVKRIKGSGTYVLYESFTEESEDDAKSDKISSRNIALFAKCKTDIFSYILSNLQNIAFSHGFSITVFDIEAKTLEKEEMINDLMSGKFCGIICHPICLYNFMPYYLEIINRNIPRVFLDENLPMLNVPTIRSDNRLGGYKATKYLIENGHTNIGMVITIPFNENEQERFLGYLQALSESGIRFNVNNIFTYEQLRIDKTIISSQWFFDTPRSIKENLKEILSNKDRPTAFFCVYDEIASLLEQHIYEAGFKVPQDLSIVGYNNSIFCEHMITPLTSVNQHYKMIAEIAFNTIIKILNNQPVKSEYLVEPSIVERASVKQL